MLNLFFTLMAVLLLAPAAARADDAGAAQSGFAIRSVTLAGGPILSKHFQSGEDNFNEHHAIGILKLETASYGTWGFYFLNPNSVHKLSVGAGYITHPYTIPLGPTELELTAGLGLVSGYQDYPVPMLAGEARLVLYRHDAWNVGVEAAAMPYIARDEDTDKNKFGIVATTPFLSVRYRFR